jgi:hypothetical protein
VTHLRTTRLLLFYIDDKVTVFKHLGAQVA